MEKKDHFVRIDNILAESRFNYTQEEMDLLFYLMLIIKKDQETYTFSVKDINDFSGKEHHRKRIRNSFRQLGKLAYEIDYSEDEWDMLWLFRSVKVANGIVNVHLNESILPLLCDLKDNYTLLELSGGFSLNGKYSKRLYLLLSRWKNLKSKIYDLATLIEILKYSNKANQISDFKRTIHKAVDDINISTCLSVSVEWIKTGKSISHVKFDIHNSNDVANIDFQNSIDLIKSKRLLCSAGISPEQVERLYIEGCDYERIKSIYDKANDSLRRRDLAVADPAAYLLTCFRTEGFLQLDKKEKDLKKIEMYRGLIEAGTPIENLRPLLKKEGISVKDVTL